MKKKYLLFSFCLFAIPIAFAKAETCKDVPQKDDMHSQTVCFYPYNSLELAYQDALKQSSEDAKYLKRTLPKKHYVDDSSEVVNIEYNPKSASRYVINLGYGGGETVWTMVKLPHKVKITFDYYPD